MYGSSYNNIVTLPILNKELEILIKEKAAVSLKDTPEHDCFFNNVDNSVVVQYVKNQTESPPLGNTFLNLINGKISSNLAAFGSSSNMDLSNSASLIKMVLNDGGGLKKAISPGRENELSSQQLDLSVNRPQMIQDNTTVKASKNSDMGRNV